jgi:tetratricopeptide (TPR) repeat protein
MNLLAIVLALAPAPVAQSIDDAQKPQIDSALRSIAGGRPQVALDTLAPVIATYEADQAKETRHVYCGMSITETLVYMTLPDPDKKGAVALSPGYCTALYLKGYALIDLGRIADARAIYQRVVSLAPMHAHFLTELGQSYRYEKNWPMMLETCKRAEAAVEFAGDSKNVERALAWHCQGYALTELGRLDEAEKLYRECLRLDPDDTHARKELDYIAEQRRQKS